MQRIVCAMVGLLGIAAASGCSDDEGGSGGAGGTGGQGGSGPGWRTVLDGEDLDRAALSVWGADAEAVFVAGGPLGNTPFETLALFYDGQGWRDLAPGGSETFWWVHGTAADDVWMVGEQGRVEHFDGSGWTRHDVGVQATLWGVFAVSESDVWVVGGTPGGGTAAQNDIVLRYDASGAGWTQLALPGEPRGVALYKVWAASADDVYVVGEQGTIWHWRAGGWTLEDASVSGTLFTVNGCSASEIYAVGGNAVLASDGQGSWSPVAVSLSNQVNGVSCAGGAGDGVVLAGAGGLKQRLVAGSWIDEFTEKPYDDFHAAWSASPDEHWIAGGAFVAMPSPGTPREGVVARYGAGTVADAIMP